MSVLSEVQEFLSDLVLGDFADNPSSASIVVNGAIGLIPIVDQVLDARDVTAQVLKCSKKGWGKLEEDDYANLAFTAIGLVPSFGSFFKGAVKPLWRERKLVGRGVQQGLAMLERALGMGKGGVVRWVNAINWAQRTQQAAYAAQSAIDAYIGMLQAIAQDPWWASSALVRQAKNQIPLAQQSKLYVSEAIKRGSKLIEGFLKDLLGEHAVWVQVAASAAHGSAKTTKKTSNSNKIATDASKKANKTRKDKDDNTKLHNEQHEKVSKDKKTQAKPEKTSVSAVQQATRKVIKSVGSRYMGLVGEHLVDYHVLRQQGHSYAHASFKPMKSGDKLYKVNHAEHRPIELTAEDLGNVNKKGIDSLWKKAGGKYLVVEAKARTDATHYWALKKANEQNKGAQANNRNKKQAADKGEPTEAAWMRTLSAEQKILSGALSDTSDKAGYGGAMQMSRDWIRLAAPSVVKLRDSEAYDRQVHVVSTVPKLANGLMEHTGCVVPAVAGGKDYKHQGQHDTHGVSYSFFEADIAAVEKAREKPGSVKEQQSDKTVPQKSTTHRKR